MNNRAKYIIDNKNLKLINNKSETILTFDFPFRQVIQFHDCYVIRLEPDIGKIYNENVFGVSRDGKILWQIEAMEYVYKDSPFTGAGAVGNLVQLCNWDGTDLLIDPHTGKIIKKGYSK